MSEWVVILYLYCSSYLTSHDVRLVTMTPPQNLGHKIKHFSCHATISPYTSDLSSHRWTIKVLFDMLHYSDMFIWGAILTYGKGMLAETS